MWEYKAIDFVCIRRDFFLQEGKKKKDFDKYCLSLINSIIYKYFDGLGSFLWQIVEKQILVFVANNILGRLSLFLNYENT